MNPHTGDLVTEAELADLERRDPAEAAKYSVKLEGAEKEVRSIAQAVMDAVGAEDIAKAESTSTKMLLAMSATGKKVYEGTVPAVIRRRRRAKNKAARIARRSNR